MRNVIRSAAFVLAALVVVHASAHDLPVQRSAIVQIHQDRVDVLMMYAESPGPRTEQLLLKYDLDKDGRIDGDKERLLALPEISKRIAIGVSFEVPGETPQMQRPEIKLKKDRSGALSAALLVSYKLSAMKPGRERTLRIRVHDRKGNAPLVTLVEAGEGLVLVSSDTFQNDGHETLPMELKPGSDVRITVQMPSEETDSPDETAGSSK